MKLPGFVTRTAFEIGKHSPTILVAVGVVGVVASAVGACMATRKLDDTIDAYRKNKEAIEDEDFEMKNEEGKFEKIDNKKRKELRVQNRIKLAIELCKLYGLPLLGLAASIACIIGAQIILRKRNAILATALASATKTFDEYRKRVSDRFGDEVERQIRYNMQPDGDPVTVVDVDENGKSHKSKLQNYVIDLANGNPDDNVLYFVRGYSELWRDDDYYNENAINGIINTLKYNYEKDRVLFGNEIRRAFGADIVLTGQGFGYNWKDGDSVDIRYTNATFKDSVHGDKVNGFLIELVGLHNILDSAFKNPNTSLEVAV